MRLPSRPRHRRDRSRGQSLVEFALLLPVILLITLTAIDLGRVFLGWVNLQQMTRVAAGQASEHASAWSTPGDAGQRAKYRTKIANDARLINCQLPNPLPDPVFAAGTTLGAPVRVSLSCQFSIATPVISNIIGGTILVSAETTYPVREGAVATVPGGGAPVVAPPVARFVATPRSGWSPLQVQLTDQSLNAPTSWTWDFNTGPSGTGAGTVSPGTSVARGPHTVTYTCTGTPGQTCTFGAVLTVGNSGGTDTLTRSDYITVSVPPPTGPIADFSVTPRSGTEPLTVSFQFVDLRAGTVTYTQYQWDFTNDGTFDATGPSATHTYPTDGSYDVRLRVTDSTGATSELTKVGAVVVTDRICVVPDFANRQRNEAQGIWAAAGFTTTVTTLPSGQGQGNGNYQINYQSLVGGTINPQPNGCGSTITVGP